MRLILLFILPLFCFAACSKQDEASQQYSSYDYLMDGSRFIPDIGIPATSSLLAVSGKDSNANMLITAPPVEIPGGEKYLYAFALGNTVMEGNETSSQILASLPGTKPITQLLTDREAIYAIHCDGEIHTFNYSGKLLWQYRTAGFDESDPHLILTENTLIAQSDSGITAIDLHSGKNIWSYPTFFPPSKIIYDSKSKLVIAMLPFDADSFTSDDTLNRRAKDSILCFTQSGIIKSRFGFADRIISNLCLCGKEKNLVAFGYLHQPRSGEIRSIHVAVFSGIETGAPKKISDHELSYLPIHIASNGSMVLSSGFYGTGSSIESGIDAFVADDTMKLWQRRFSYPLVTPVSVSNKYVYFSLVFTTEAEIPTHSIFYTLDVSTGKTLSELPVTGAKNGFSPGIPMPLQEKEFILSDRNSPALYFLKP